MTQLPAPPLVSAIMPARDSSATIVSAISSIQQQSLQDWELIVVDDGSTDDTAAKAQGLAEGDARIRVIRSAPLGRGGARNLCLAHARGTYIAICDSDDISTPTRFERQVALLERDHQVDVVSCARVIALTPAGVPSFAISAPAQHSAVVAALHRGRMPVLFASSMLRSRVFTRLGGFDTALQRCQDFGFFHRHRHGLVFATLPEALLLYRTSGRTVGVAMLYESNLYRRLAIKRSNGFSDSASVYQRSVEGLAWTALAFPLQLAWYLTSRTLVRRRIFGLSEDEMSLLADAHRRSSALSVSP